MAYDNKGAGDSRGNRSNNNRGGNGHGNGGYRGKGGDSRGRGNGDKGGFRGSKGQGGYKKYDGERKFDRDDNRGGYKGGKPQGGYKGRGDRDNRGEGRKFDRDNRGPKRDFKRDDNRGGYKKHDGERKFDHDGDRGGYKGGRDFDRKPRGDRRDGDRDFKRGGYKKDFSRDERKFEQGERKFDRDGRKFDRDDRGPKRERSFDGDKRDDRRFDKRDGGKFEGRGDRRFDDRPKKRFDDDKRGFKPRRDDERSDAQVDDDAPRSEYREHRRKGEGYRGTGGGYRKPKGQVHVTPARQAACAIGRVVRERNAYVAEVTPAVLAKFQGISPEDAAFATKIARGVTATVGTLDEFINRNMKTPNDIDEVVRDAMRVSAYELLFLDKPAYVVVDQGVELVCSVAPKAGGLANAVLRRMSESAKTFPFGNPNLSLQVLARSQAFPMWLAKRLMNEMTLPKATAFMRACNTDAPVFIAVNSVKGDFEQIEEAFDQAGSLLEPSEDVQGCYRVKEARSLRSADVRALFEAGELLVSDEGAQTVAQLAMPAEEPASFLEIGSGRGTKTILLQSAAHRAFGHCVPMTSVDDHEFKGKILGERCAAYGIDTVEPFTADARTLSQKLPEASFDAVLLDAPCSGVGTLRRHPEIRWRLKPEDITSMASINLDLLIEAAKMVKPGGVITYATCTVFPEENEQVVERFLKTKFGEQFEIEEQVQTTLTSNGPDAHYAVRLRRHA